MERAFKGRKTTKADRVLKTIFGHKCKTQCNERLESMLNNEFSWDMNSSATSNIRRNFSEIIKDENKGKA